MGFYAIEDYVCQRYTREQAIAEGLLVDISEVTVNLGFLAPVAMTKMAWSMRSNGLRSQQIRKI